MPRPLPGLRRGFVPRYLHALAGSAWLFAGGFLDPRHRVLLRRINEHFGRSEGPAPRLPQVPPESLDPPSVPVTLLETAAADGNVTLLELLVLARSVAARRPRLLLELGTFDGRTTLNLAANAPEDARVLTLDLPRAEGAALALDARDAKYIDKPAPGARFRGTPWEGRIEQLLGDSASFDFSPWHGRCEWVFVDAAHSYEYVLNDSRLALRLLAPGGVVFWHDYGVWEGVTLALDELQRAGGPWAGLRWLSGTSLVVLEGGAGELPR